MTSQTKAPSTTIRVVVVDDHALVRSGLEGILLLYADIELVGQAESGEAAIAVCEQTRPDVVLMDLVMPGLSGVTTTEEILRRLPDTRVIALTSFSDTEWVESAVSAGAIGYLMKNVSGDQLVAAIRAAHAGRATLAPEAAEALVHAVQTRDAATQVLTRRERQVLALMVEGLTNPNIADRLQVSLSTVKTHVSAIIAKLGVSSRTEAATTAIRNRIV